MLMSLLKNELLPQLCGQGFDCHITDQQPAISHQCTRATLIPGLAPQGF